MPNRRDSGRKRADGAPAKDAPSPFGPLRCVMPDEFERLGVMCAVQLGVFVFHAILHETDGSMEHYGWPVCTSRVLSPFCSFLFGI